MPSHTLFHRVLFLCVGAVLLSGLYNGFTQPELTVAHPHELNHHGLAHEELVHPSPNDGNQLVQKRALSFGTPDTLLLNYSKRATDWDSMVSKGCKLVDLMNADVAGATTQMQQSNSGLASSQSTWVNYGDLQTYGWATSDWTEMLDFKLSIPIITALEGLALSTTSGWVGGPNSLLHTGHEVETTVAGTTYQPSGAFFDQIYNPIDGVIIVWGAYGPASKGPKQTPPVTVFPPLRQWSDVTYLEWANLAGNQVMLLNYLFQTSIENSVTQSIISQALSNRGATQSRWPGTTFRMDTDEGKAILATPNGNGIAWFLIQHKIQLGRKAVSEVTVFTDDGPAANRAPSAVFHIVDVP